MQEWKLDLQSDLPAKTAHLVFGFTKSLVQLSDIPMHFTLHRDIREMDKRLGKAKGGIHSLSWQVKGIWGVMLVGFMLCI